MADLSSILGGMVQGFKDFGTGLVDMFGTGGAAIGDAIASIQSGRATTKNQDDFRKWLYNTDSTKDAAAKGLGTALNGVSTVADVIPGAQAVTANPLFNGIQGAIGGVADELKMNGENADWGRAAQRAGVGAASGLASGYAGQALGKSGNKLLSNGLTRGAVSGALGGGIANAGYTGIEGGSVQDMINAGLYGAQTGALVGGTTGLARELIKPTHKMDARLTDAERQARIENAQAQIDELGPVPLFSDDPEYVAKRARKLELNDAIKAYRSGYDTVDEYNSAMAAKRANRPEYKAPEAQYAPRIGEEVMLEATQAPEGYTRLYRGLENEFDPKYVPQVSDNGYGYESWSDTYDLAREYAGPDGNVYTVDVPNSRIATQTVTPDGERMPVVKTDKKAGMKSFDGERFIEGKEYLLNVNDPLRQELTYSKVRAKNVADLMNEPKQKTVADLMLSPEQEAFFKNSQIRDSSGNLKKLYHGSPNGEFNTFSKDYASAEGDWGKGFYFTDSEADVRKNYYDGGPDFDNKIARRAEQLEGELDIPYEQAEKQARSELYKGAYQIDAYANMENPATVGKTMLFDGSEYPVRNLSDYDNIDDYYTDLIYDLSDDVINDTGIDYEYKQPIMAALDEARWDGGISLQGLKDKLNELYIEDYDGNLMGNEVARSIVENLGYDGIIDPTVANKFNNMGINEGTTHYIAFKPNQVKKTTNLNPTINDDIRYGKAPSNVAELMAEKKTPTNVAELMDDKYKRIGSADVAPINHETLPDSLRMANEYINEGYIKDIEKTMGKPYSKMTDNDFLEYSLRNKKPEDRELFKQIINDMVKDGTTTYEKYAKSAASNKYLRNLADTKLTDMDSDSLMRYLANNKHKLTDNFTKAADAELSDRLGIGRSNTLMMDNISGTEDAYGVYNPMNSTISLNTSNLGEGDARTNVAGHERLHSFQTESKMNRYDPEVISAYKDLRKELRAAKAFKNKQEIKDYWGESVDYFKNNDEQEARMFQQYLEKKGFTDKAPKASNKVYHEKNVREFDNDKITPAFDKFLDKLRALSKKGVALPALTALFGGGAIMAATQSDDKKKKSEVK
jgi:hypothetical protein